MLTKDWVTPIETTDYANVVIKKKSRDEQPKIDHFEDGTVASGYKLNAKVKMTFAGLKTGNSSVYLPDEMFAGARSFIHPFPKPVLKHHNESEDPIGRVVDVRYVDTASKYTPHDSRAASAMRVFKDKSASKKAKLATVKTFLDLEREIDEYQGFGYLYGLWEVTDPDAIVKIIDKRILTVSTSFSPKGAYCSTCADHGELTDWRTSECEHKRGKVYDGYVCVAVPYGFTYTEVSGVTDPAAIYAMITEVGENLTFSDAMSKVERPFAMDIFSDVKLVKSDSVSRFKDSLDSNEKTSPNKPVDVIGNIEPTKTNPQEEIEMSRLKDLTKDSVSNYDALVKFLPEGQPRLTGDLLAEIKDSDFAGPRRTFLVKDLTHALAAKSLLETAEESENKTVLMSAIEDRILQLTPVEVTETVETNAVIDVPVETVEEDAAPVADSAPAEETVTVPKVDWEQAQRDQDLLVDLKDSVEILKTQLEASKSSLVAIKTERDRLLKDNKSLLAEAVVDQMISKGFTISDRKAKTEELKGRSLESLRDSLADLATKAVTGIANPVVVRPSAKEDIDSSKDGKVEADLNRKRYKTIFDRFDDLYYKPNGEAVALAYWRDQQARGFIPVTVNP